MASVNAGIPVSDFIAAEVGFNLTKPKTCYSGKFKNDNIAHFIDKQRNRNFSSNKRLNKPDLQILNKGCWLIKKG
jgi:hypothetical protein